VHLSWLLLWAAAGCGDGVLSPDARGPVDLSRPWATAAPAAVGVDGGALRRALDEAAGISRLRSLLVVRDGRLVAERYYNGFDRDSLADVRSVTKSVVSMLVGIAVARGDLDGVETPIGDILPPSVAILTEEQAGITVRDLLTMSGGWQWHESGDGGDYNRWVTSGNHLGYLLDRPTVAAPGTTFAYNSAAVHLLGVVLEEVVGRSLPAYADEHLFGPLGITDRRWEAMGGRVNGGAGLDLRPRDLARLGQLFLQEGSTGDAQLLPASWVLGATAPAYDWSSSYGPLDDLNYGYLWWLDRTRGAYLAWGYGGQFLYVAPNRALVVVCTTEWRHLGQDGGPTPLTTAVLDVIVNGIVPAVPLR
jgi:CubicO group peptidase (beta-lactamase class C family)